MSVLGNFMKTLFEKQSNHITNDFCSNAQNQKYADEFDEGLIHN